MKTVEQDIAGLVLAVHRRNGGRLLELDLQLRLLDPALGLDSLDLAEIMAGVERRFGVSVFDGETVPVIWADVVRAVRQAETRNRG
jgi:acyl carrier protein